MRVTQDIYQLVKEAKTLERKMQGIDKSFFESCLSAYEEGTLKVGDAARFFIIIDQDSPYRGQRGYMIQETKHAVLLEVEVEVEQISGFVPRQVMFDKEDVMQGEGYYIEEAQTLIDCSSNGFNVVLYEYKLDNESEQIPIQIHLHKAICLAEQDAKDYVDGLSKDERSNFDFHTSPCPLDITFPDSEDNFIKIHAEVSIENGTFETYWYICNHTQYEMFDIQASKDLATQIKLVCNMLYLHQVAEKRYKKR